MSKTGRFNDDMITVTGKSKSRQANAAKHRERIVAKCKGWVIGREIDLPRPIVNRIGYPDTGGGRELAYGHIRSGHMRLQPCGPQNSLRRLIFVAPTIVRPDLELRQTHGYRLHDKPLVTK